MTIWKHSPRDGFLAAAAAGLIFFNIWLAATWTERSALEICLLWPIAVGLFWYNATVATHNFLHTPWFVHRTANRIFAVFNSINLAVPQVLCWFHHFNHHRHGNDRLAPDGRTKDHSSTYRFGKNGHHEHLLSYCGLGLFRGGIVEAYGEMKRKGRWNEFLLQLVVCGCGLAGYLYLSWQYFLFFFVPMFYAGAFLGMMTNYYQHAGASPDNRSANSVSYYGRVYNLLFCNEGYHQEHHLYPQLHWTGRPQMRLLLPSEGRVVSRFPPSLAFLAQSGAPVESSSPDSGHDREGNDELHRHQRAHGEPAIRHDLV